MQTITRRPPSIRTGSTAEPPRWARRAAALTVVTTVPSTLWRVAMVLGVPVGVDAAYREQRFSFPSWGTAYVLSLDIILVSLSCLTLGLVRGWGEVAPAWMPVIGGRPIHRLAAIIPAGIGACALTILWTAIIGAGSNAIFDEFGLHGAERAIVLACYLPLLFWGPLLAAVTVSYARRTRPARSRTSSVMRSVSPGATSPVHPAAPPSPSPGPDATSAAAASRC